MFTCATTVTCFLAEGVSTVPVVYILHGSVPAIVMLNALNNPV